MTISAEDLESLKHRALRIFDRHAPHCERGFTMPIDVLTLLSVIDLAQRVRPPKCNACGQDIQQSTGR